MDNGKMGAFISEMRKSQNLTQKELAHKLEVTDKAVSKWERGISCPDVSLLIPLSEALGVSVSELLNGEKNPVPEEKKENIVKEEIVKETLRYSGQSTANKIEKVKNGFLAFFTVSFLLAAAICLICDFCITGKLTWSLIVLFSLLFSWAILYPFFRTKQRIIRQFLLNLSLLILPYLALLAWILKEPDIIKLGAIISLISLLGLWLIYFTFVKLSRQKLCALGILWLLLIPIQWSINYVSAAFYHESMESSSIFVSKIISMSLILLSVLCFAGEFFIDLYRRSSSNKPL